MLLSKGIGESLKYILFLTCQITHNVAVLTNSTKMVSFNGMHVSKNQRSSTVSQSYWKSLCWAIHDQTVDIKKQVTNK